MKNRDVLFCQINPRLDRRDLFSGTLYLQKHLRSYSYIYRYIYIYSHIYLNSSFIFTVTLTVTITVTLYKYEYVGGIHAHDRTHMRTYLQTEMVTRFIRGKKYTKWLVFRKIEKKNVTFVSYLTQQTLMHIFLTVDKAVHYHYFRKPLLTSRLPDFYVFQS